MDERTLAKLSAVVGTNRKAVVEAEGIPKQVYPGMEVEAYRGRMSTVAAVYTDFLGNEAYITEFHLNEHIASKKGYGPFAVSIAEELLKTPEYLVVDKQERALLYGKEYQGAMHNMYFAVIGQDTGQYYTVVPRHRMFTKQDRYDILRLKGNR